MGRRKTGIKRRQKYKKEQAAKRAMEYYQKQFVKELINKFHKMMKEKQEFYRWN